jgi:DNA-binding GntR family transcriptional regulator
MSKQQHAYTVIREGIISGRFGPDHRLVLDELSRELSVSTVPVREAIRRLEAEGLVRFEPNVGPRVTTLDADEFDAVMRVLALLEGYATACAAEHVDAATIEAARALNGRMRGAVAANKALVVSRLNREFHTMLHDECRNAHLLTLLGQTWARLDVIRSSIFLYIPLRGLTSVEEHEQLLSLIERSADASEIETFVRDHEIRTADAFAQHQREAGTGEP